MYDKTYLESAHVGMVNKIDNVSIRQYWSAFALPLLPWKSK